MKINDYESISFFFYPLIPGLWNIGMWESSQITHHVQEYLYFKKKGHVQISLLTPMITQSTETDYKSTIYIASYSWNYQCVAHTQHKPTLERGWPIAELFITVELHKIYKTIFENHYSLASDWISVHFRSALICNWKHRAFISI